MLKRNHLITETVGRDGEDVVLPLGDARGLVVDQAVAKDVVLRQAVVVPVDAGQQARQLVQVALEWLGHVVVEHVAVGLGVHHHNGAVKLASALALLPLDEVKVGNRLAVVILKRVGVEHQEFHAACNESEVSLAIDPLKGLLARAQAVVVADARHVRHPQLAQDGPLPLVLLHRAKVGEVAVVDEKHHLGALVQVFDERLGLVIPPLSVARGGKDDGVSAEASLLDEPRVLLVQAGCARDVNIVGVIIDVAASSKRYDQQCRCYGHSSFHGRKIKQFFPHLIPVIEIQSPILRNGR